MKKAAVLMLLSLVLLSACSFNVGIKNDKGPVYVEVEEHEDGNE
ncbi:MULTISPECIES: hypothetical protein [Evansella]|jgi:hypothetical protein|nr:MULTISPECIES: hypothetical protein [Evansella]